MYASIYAPRSMYLSGHAYMCYAMYILGPCNPSITLSFFIFIHSQLLLFRRSHRVQNIYHKITNHISLHLESYLHLKGGQRTIRYKYNSSTTLIDYSSNTVASRDTRRAAGIVSSANSRSPCKCEFGDN